MARLKNPLMSLDASGTIAGQITTQVWKGRAYFRKKPSGKPTLSINQRYARTMMSFLNGEWARIPLAHPSWTGLATASNFTNFNAFIQHNLNGWQQTTTPTVEPSPPTFHLPPSPFITSAIGGKGIITVTVNADTNGFEWGFWLELSNLIDNKPHKGTITAVFSCFGWTAGNDFTYLMGQIPKGHYTALQLKTFSTDGAALYCDTAGPINVT